MHKSIAVEQEIYMALLTAKPNDYGNDSYDPYVVFVLFCILFIIIIILIYVFLFIYTIYIHGYTIQFNVYYTVKFTTVLIQFNTKQP